MTILVAGIGNLFDSDDGFGPEVVRRLAEHAPGSLSTVEDVRIVDYGIRGMHLAYDLLEGYDALVLVDAVAVGDVPGEVTVLEVGPDDVATLGSGDLDAHGMSPVAVLASLERLGGTLPRTYVVGCRPETTEEGIGLSDVVADAVPVAVEVVAGLTETLLVGGRV
jgi:hydrogenase maturation protease